MRFRGADQLGYVIADIKRSIELGFRGFLVIDEGLLWALNELRKAGEIPKDVKFKVSIFAGHANPAGAKVLESLGADTFNPVADLNLPQLAAFEPPSGYRSTFTSTCSTRLAGSTDSTNVLSSAG
jgi:hypothetical protein